MRKGKCEDNPLATTSMFYPEQGESSLPAKAFCIYCPIKRECARLGFNEGFGIWGGLSETDRKWCIEQLKEGVPLSHSIREVDKTTRERLRKHNGKRTSGDARKDYQNGAQ